MLKQVLPLLLVISLLASCLPSGNLSAALESHTWRAENLKLIDPIDASSPDMDLVAAYSRCSADGLEVRLDFLDSLDPWSYDLYLALNTQPGGDTTTTLGFPSSFAWDVWIRLPSKGTPDVHFSDGRSTEQLRPRTWRNTRQDYITVSLADRTFCSGDIQIQAFLTRAGQNQLVDQTSIFRLQDPPAARAPLLLAFWNTLPGATPAQALRRWNGAHTGPFGQRHGLSVLLRAADDHQIPLALLDLKSPGSLSALEALGGTGWVQNMQRRGLLLLPEYIEGNPGKGNLIPKITRQVEQNFLLSSSVFFFGEQQTFSVLKNSLVFAKLDQVDHLAQSGRFKTIPLPSQTDSTEADVDPENGLGIDRRRELIRLALSPDPTDLLVLGGSLPDSPWADSLIANPAMEYIANHPWIRPLNADDLAAWPAPEEISTPLCTDWLCAEGQNSARPFDPYGNPQPLTSDQLQENIRTQLAGLPENPFTEQSWLALSSLTKAGSPDFQQLQANYLGEIGYLIQASHWAEQPKEINTCDEDMDWDGMPECILASDQFFTILETDGGRLAFAAAQDGRKFFQVLGMQSQFGVGLSDPVEWSFEQGPRSDPYVSTGAFDDANIPPETYTPEVKSREIQMVGSGSGYQKEYSLVENGLQIVLRQPGTIQASLPLVVDPLQRFQRNWIYRYLKTTTTEPDVFQWGSFSGGRIEIHTTGRIDNFDTSLDSMEYIRQPEDPNRTYPPGHFIPFPMAQLTLSGENELKIFLGTKP